MVRHKHLRQRPSTPNLKASYSASAHSPPLTLNSPSSASSKPLTAVAVPRTADPASPPETPTTSPHTTRKSSQKPRHQPPPFHDFDALHVFVGNEDINIRPLGHGHKFSYRPKPSDPSPRSSSSSEADDESDSVASSIGAEPNADSSPEQSDNGHAEYDETSSESGSGSDSEVHSNAKGQRTAQASRLNATVTEILVEEIDPMDSDYEGLDALFPHEVESVRSNSRSRPTPEAVVLDTFERLNCSNEASNDDAWSTTSSSSSSISQDSAELAFYRRQVELKRMRRLSMSSLGKRTHSEISGGSDDETGINDVNELGSSAQRMRKRLHRTSLLFQDPPAPRIDELDEPDSSEDERRDIIAGLSLAHELPYYDIEVVEIESS